MRALRAGLFILLLNSSLYAQQSWERLVHLAQEDLNSVQSSLHEAAHIIADEHLATGLRIESLRLSRRGEGLTNFQPDENFVSRSDAASLARRRAAVLMAGDLAEVQFLDRLRSNPRLGGEARRRLASRRGALGDRAQIEYELENHPQLYHPSLQLSSQIVAANWDQIIKLSVLLLEDWRAHGGSNTQMSFCREDLKNLLLQIPHKAD